MAIMPYNLEKGPYLAMLEDLMNRDPVRCLRSLRMIDQPVTALLRELNEEIPGGPHGTTAELADHIDQHWFGLDSSPGEPSRGTSRYWSNWRGDAQSIARETLVRAIEVALDIEHGARPPRSPSRRWHISLLTSCGIRWFEGWVTWQRLGDAPEAGQVSVLILTPTHGKPVEPTLLRPLPAPEGAPQRPAFRHPGLPYSVNPRRAEGQAGMWAVGSLFEYRQDPVEPSGKWVGSGQFPRPRLGPTYVGQGDVVVVAPPEDQGGVLPGGRPYKPARRAARRPS
jgi:hypothetical protein